MRQDEDDSAISLFSFQDIITSLTGIMFLIVLLLLLIAVTAPPPSPAPAPRRQDQSGKLAELRRQLAELENHDREMSRRLAELRRQSPAEVERRLNERRSELTDLQRRYDHAVRERQELQTQLRLRQEDLSRLGTELQTLEKRENDLRNETDRQTRELAERRRANARAAQVITYSIDSATNRHPVLVEVGADGVRLLELSSGQATDFRVAGNGEAGIRKFLAWAAARTDRQEYYSLLFKPGGFRYAGELQAKLKELALPRGIEILPNDQATIFTESEP